MTFAESIRSVYWTNYANFRGRASRSEYWWITLFNYLVILCTIGLANGLDYLYGDTGFNVGFTFFALFMLFALVPGIAVTIRRLHDSGRSGWWSLIVFLPYLGAFVLYAFAIMPSNGDNKWGHKNQLTELSSLNLHHKSPITFLLGRKVGTVIRTTSQIIKNKRFWYATVACVVICIGGFAFDYCIKQERQSKTLFRIQENGLYGFIDSVGNVMLDPQYKYISDFSDEGYAFVVDSIENMETIHFHYIDKTGRSLDFKESKGVFVSFEISRDTLNKLDGNVLSFCDRILPELESMPEQKREWSQEYLFSSTDNYIDGRKWIKKDFILDPWILIDKDSNQLGNPIDCDTCILYPTFYGLSYMVGINSGIMRFVEDNGTIRKEKYIGYTPFSNEICALSKAKGIWFIVDSKLAKKTNETFEGVGIASDGLLPVKKGGKWGCVDYSINQTIPFDYDTIGNFNHGLAYFKKTLNDVTHEGYLDVNESIIWSHRIEKQTFPKEWRGIAYFEFLNRKYPNEYKAANWLIAGYRLELDFRNLKDSFDLKTINYPNRFFVSSAYYKYITQDIWREPYGEVESKLFALVDLCSRSDTPDIIYAPVIYYSQKQELYDNREKIALIPGLASALDKMFIAQRVWMSGEMQKKKFSNKSFDIDNCSSHIYLNYHSNGWVEESKLIDGICIKLSSKSIDTERHYEVYEMQTCNLVDLVCDILNGEYNRYWFSVKNYEDTNEKKEYIRALQHVVECFNIEGHERQYAILKDCISDLKQEQSRRKRLGLGPRVKVYPKSYHASNE